MTAAAMTVASLLLQFDAAEEWRPIPGFPGYEVSSWGRVSGQRVAFLDPSETKGYRHVKLYANKRAKNERVTKLVAAAFLGPPPFEGAQAAHNDGNSQNDRASNLRWTTCLDNHADIERHGTRRKGSRVAGSKLREGDIPAIRSRLADRENVGVIAADFGVSKTAIAMISQGKSWSHVL